MVFEAISTWREPLAADWRECGKLVMNELQKGLDGNREFAAKGLRRLSGMRLGDGERLHLRRMVRAARDFPGVLPGFRLFRLLLLSNRTLGFWAGDIEAACAARGLLMETIEGGYDTVRAFALDARTPVPEGSFDAVLLLLDAGFFSFSHNLLDATAESGSIDEARKHLAQLLAGLRGRFKAPLIASTIASPPEWQISSSDAGIVGVITRCIEALNESLVEHAVAGHVVLFDLAGLAGRVGTMQFFDPVSFFHAKVPFALEVGPIVADALGAIIAAMVGRSGRVLVVDLDNTLWGGVIADDGLEGIILGNGSAYGEAFLEIQRFALELRRRGVILAACSKNIEEIAREPFRTHPEMLLREEHFAAFLANFEDKATNVAKIAQMLDLDPSSLVFLDDNAAERERVRSALPFVMVPEVGEDPALFVRSVAASGFFEHPLLTPEDTGRAAAYQARAEARALQASIEDYETYLKLLQMELTISPFDAVGRPRIAQLLQKSNQFNLTTKRYSELEVAEIEKDSRRLGWQVRLKDRFADHGMICVVVVDKFDHAWSIDSWVMSCRVLQRGVEQVVMRQLVRHASREGASQLLGVYRPTARNALVRDFYPRLGFEPVESEDLESGEHYRLDLAKAAFPCETMRVTFAADV